MTTAEARRLDLYNALTEFIGADRADTLMASLPSQEANELATRSDILTIADRINGVDESLSSRVDRVDESLSSRIDRVDESLSGRMDRLEDRMTAGFEAVNRRLDRLFLTLALR
jgi:hypothetical protein